MRRRCRLGAGPEARRAAGWGWRESCSRARSRNSAVPGQRRRRRGRRGGCGELCGDKAVRKRRWPGRSGTSKAGSPTSPPRLFTCRPEAAEAAGSPPGPQASCLQLTLVVSALKPELPRIPQLLPAPASCCTAGQCAALGGSGVGTGGVWEQPMGMQGGVSVRARSRPSSQNRPMEAKNRLAKQTGTAPRTELFNA